MSRKKPRTMKIVLMTLSLLAMLFLLVGCGLADKLQEWKNSEETPSQEENQGGTDEDIQPLPQQGLDSSTGEQREVVLYFAASDGQSLQQETRSIPKTEGVARATISELINGPQNETLLPTIPNSTMLESIKIDEGLCTVDFSSELVDHHPGGLLNEELTVYSIVNTLTQFSTIDEVKILVDGQEIDTIAGHVDVSATMSRNPDLIN